LEHEVKDYFNLVLIGEIGSCFEIEIDNDDWMGCYW
jgi:hypothetical protein